MLDLLSAFTIATAMVTLVSVQALNYLDDRKAATVAEHLRQVAQAGERYIAEQIPSQTASILMTDLKAYLGNTPTTNILGQTPCIRRLGNQAVLVTTGGVSPSVKVRNRISQLLGPGSANYYNSSTQMVNNTNINGYTSCGGSPTSDGPAIFLSVRPSSPAPLRYVHRLPYRTDSNMMSGDLAIANQNITGTKLIKASNINSSSSPLDQFYELISKVISVSELKVSSTRTNQKIGTFISSDMILSGTLPSSNPNCKNCYGELSSTRVLVGSDLRTGLVFIPEITSATSKDTCASENTFAHINGIPYVCKNSMWQPIQLATNTYTSGDLGQLNAIKLPCRFSGIGNEILLSAGGSAGHSSQNYYFEAQDIRALTAKLFVSTGPTTGLKDFYIGGGTQNPEYTKEWRTIGAKTIHNSAPYIRNAGIDVTGILEPYPTNGVNHSAWHSATSDWRTANGGYSEVGDTVRSTVICGRGMGISTSP